MDLFIFFPHAVPFPFTFGWTRSNPNVPFLPRWPNNPTLDIQPEPFSSFANFITAFKLMRSAEWTEKSISEALICVLFLVVLADWPRYCSKQKTMCAVKYSPMWETPCFIAWHISRPLFHDIEQVQYWNYWRVHISEYPIPLSDRRSRLCFLIKEVVSHWSWSHRGRHAATWTAASLWWLWCYWERRVTSSSDQVDQVDHFHLVFLQDHDGQMFSRDTLENPSNTT